MLEQNKAVARRAHEEVWSKGNLAAAEIFTPDFFGHQHSHPEGPQAISDLDVLKAFVREFREPFPGFHNTVEAQIAEYVYGRHALYVHRYS